MCTLYALFYAAGIASHLRKASSADRTTVAVGLLYSSFFYFQPLCI